MQGDKITLQFLSVRVDWLTWQHADRSLPRHRSVHRCCLLLHRVGSKRKKFLWSLPCPRLHFMRGTAFPRRAVEGLRYSQRWIFTTSKHSKLQRVYKRLRKIFGAEHLILSIKGKHLHAWNEWRCDLKNWYYKYILYLLYDINISFLHMMKKKREKEREYMYKCIVFKSSSNSSR